MNIFYRTLLIIVCLHGSLLLHSQTTRKDSIHDYFKRVKALIDETNKLKKEELPDKVLLNKVESTEDREKVDVLLDLYTFYKYKNISYASKYNNEALELSTKIKYKKGELEASCNNAYLLFVNGAFEESISLLNRIDLPTNYATFPNLHSDVICLKSYIYSEKGEYDIALDVSLKLLSLGEKDNNDYVLMRAHGALFHYYLRNENYSRALNHCLKGLDYIIKIEEVQYLYFKIDEIARLLFKLGDTEEAIKTYKFYLKLENEMPHSGGYIQSIVYMNMSDIYTSNNQFNEAQNYISKALNLNYENDFRFRIPRALILQAKLYLKEKDTIKAIEFYEKSLSAAEDINAFDVVQSTSKILGNLHEKKGDPSKAYEYIALHNSIKDSLFTNEKEQKIVILEAKRKLKEITQKQKILALENKAQKAKIQMIISILLGIFILSLIVVFAYLKVKGKNKLLYIRTVELAKIQLEMRDKIAKLESKYCSQVVNQSEQFLTKSSTNNVIDDNVKAIILNKLNKLEKELFFIDQNCTLRKIAEELKTNPKYLSQVINQEKKSNYSNYINELRINYLLTKLLKEKDFRESKLSYIAVSIGYNNLNTFNAAFKKRQGILPSYFIKELIQETT